MQTVQILIRRHILQHQLWIYVVFQSPFYGTLGINGSSWLYNFDPLKPHFYIVKQVFTGVYIFFLFLLKNIDCGYSLEPNRRGESEYPESMFWAEIWKNIKSFNWKLSVFGGEIFNVFE